MPIDYKNARRQGLGGKSEGKDRSRGRGRGRPFIGKKIPLRTTPFTLSSPNDKVYASIDLGTNNCRLMIALKEQGSSEDSFSVLETFSKITRLGEGLVANGTLSPKAMDRTLKALKMLSVRLSYYPVSAARFIATEACRRALNGADFIAKVEQVTGLSFEIISPKEEARLAIVGCRPLLKPDIEDLVVFDIGGGSSDISLSHIENGGTVSLTDSISIPMGVLTVSEGFMGTDISDRAKATITEKVHRAMSLFEDKHHLIAKIRGGKVQIIGTSGTVTSLGAFHLGLARYDRAKVDGLRLSLAEVSEVRHRLEHMTNQERISHPCIGPERADLTLAGCAILGAICDFWTMDELMIADRGLREGILFDLMRSQKPQENSKNNSGEVSYGK